MMTNTIPGVGSPADRDDEETPSPSVVPASRPPRVENAAAFDNSKLRLHAVQEPTDATRLLRAAIEHSGQRTGIIAGAAGITRQALNMSKRGKFDNTVGTYLRILAACGARLYVAIPRKS